MVLVVAALAVGAVAGDRFGSATVPVAAPTVTVTASSTPTAIRSVLPAQALTLLDRKQRPDDLPSADLPSTLVRSSMRSISTMARAEGLTEAYVAMDTSNEFCLVLAGKKSVASSCTPPTPFPVGGLSLSSEDGGISTFVALRADGSVEMGGAR